MKNYENFQTAEVTKMNKSPCWFCENREATEDDAYKIILYGNVSKQSIAYKKYRVTWQNRSIYVPRCTRCRTAGMWVTFAGIAGFILGGINFIRILVPVPDSGWQILLAFLLWIVIWFLVWLVPAFLVIRITGIKRFGLTAKGQYPAVKTLLKDGWKIGKKPPT
jgi:hypothetical protein